jgi:hypothetical protein
VTTTNIAAEAYPVYTLDEARAACLPGWNLRCNRCGSFGATWLEGERPGWGALALCPPHGADLKAEHVRHASALLLLREVSYEQEQVRW